MVINLKLDWLSFSYIPNLTDPSDDYLSSFRRTFPEFGLLLADACILETRKSLFDHVLAFNDTCLLQYDEVDRNKNDFGVKGVNVSISSQGLAMLYDAFGLDPEDKDHVYKLFKLLRARSCRLSRIDLAFDDYSKTYRPKDYIRWWWSDQLVTSFRSVKTASCKSDVGHTFYMGARRTGKMLRIYDKDVESHGEIDAVRYEVELHSRYANDIMDKILNRETINFGDLLKDFFRVVESFEESGIQDRRHRDDLKSYSDWFKHMFFQEIQESDLSFTFSKEPVLFNRSQRWFNKIAGAVNAFRLCVGDETFMGILNNSQLTKKQLQMYLGYQEDIL